MTAASSVIAHRGTRAVQTLIERAPASGSLALWMAHRDVDALTIDAPVATDGRVIAYAPRFERLEPGLQVGWVAHQVLHVAFRHVARREALRRMLGDVDDTLYNACADALVNSSLSHLSWLALPPNALHLDRFVQRVLHEDLSVDAALMRYDVESLYRAVDDRAPRSGQSQRSGGAARNQHDRGRGDNTHGGHGAPSAATQTSGGSPDAHAAEAGESGVRADGPRSATVRALMTANVRDLLAGDGHERPEEAAEQTRAWSQRVARGHASDGEFSLLRRLGADLPRSKVPWQQALRTRLTRALVREPEPSWSRPARSWLANQGRDQRGRRLPFEPGTTSARQVPRLVVVLDVSGSIEQPLLNQLGAQLNAIARRTSARCTVIVGDDHVRDVATFESVSAARGQTIDLNLFEFPGGGGTDFAPLLAEAALHRPDTVIVLTDLDGPAGPRPPFHVLWAVPPSSATMPLPFGERLIIE